MPHLFITILVTTFLGALIFSRLWLHRHSNNAPARYRLICVALTFLVLGTIGLSFDLSFAEPKTWIGTGLMFVSAVLLDRERRRLRKLIRSKSLHEA